VSERAKSGGKSERGRERANIYRIAYMLIACHESNGLRLGRCY